LAELWQFAEVQLDIVNMDQTGVVPFTLFARNASPTRMVNQAAKGKIGSP